MVRPLPATLRGLLLLLLLLEMTALPGEAAVVLRMSLREGDDRQGSAASIQFTEKDFIKEKVNASSSFSSATVCALVRPEARQKANQVEIFNINFFGTQVSAGMDSFALYLGKHSEELIKSNEMLTAESWNSVCVGVSRAPSTPKEEVGQESWTCQVWAALHGHRILGGSISKACCGEGDSVEMSLSPDFNGTITGVTPLTGEEVEEGGTMPVAANCSTLVARNVLTHPRIHPSRVSVTVPDFGGYSNMVPVWGRFLTLDEELPEDPCLREPLQRVRLQGPRSYQEFLQMCRSLGGHLPTQKEVVGGLLEMHNCSTGEHLTWASSSEGETMRPGALCPVLLAGGGTGQRPCRSSLDCTLCLVPDGLTYTLFGPVKGFDRFYTLRTLEDGSFEFQGKETSDIYQGPRGWTLNSVRRTDKFLQGSWVMGRRRWHRSGLDSLTNTSTDCSRDAAADSSTELTLTVCDAIQFSSDDGECLPRWKRCDGHTDLPDGSDERRCDARNKIQKDLDYDIRDNPQSVQDWRDIFSKLTVDTIDKISNKDGRARVSLTLDLLWQDLRLNFFYSKNKKFIPCEEIWTPPLHLLAGHRSGPAVYPSRSSSECTIMMHGVNTSTYRELEDPLMEIGMLLKAPDITQRQTLDLDYPCYLLLESFPFGRYTCELTFNLTLNSNKGHSHTYTKAVNYDIRYEGNKDLLDFHLEKVTLRYNYTVLTLTLHLAALPDYHITNSFFPSSLLFLINYLTLYFPTTCFNERIMVSLTSLLLVVTLFSQMTNTIVQTPYYKLIDVWYVALITLCFAVVMSHALVNALRVSKEKSDAGLINTVKMARRCNTACQVLLLTCFVALVLIFVLHSKQIL